MENQYITVRIYTYYAKREFLGLLKNILLIVYKHTYAKIKKIIIPLLAYCHFKETQTYLLPLQASSLYFIYLTCRGY